MEAFSFDIKAFTFNYLIPCLIAVVCGGIIGYDREKIDRPAGLRTHALVCLGSTVFTIISYYGFAENFDPARIAAGIVTGIGFIGAGVIFRQGIFVRGVTTAASIWVVAAAGIAIGTKLYFLAFLTTALGFLILTFVKHFEDKLTKKFSYSAVITSRNNLESLDEVLKFLKSFNIKVYMEKTNVERVNTEGNNIVSMHFKLQSRNTDFSIKIMQIIREIEGIIKVEIT